jgi:hypothetical protein
LATHAAVALARDLATEFTENTEKDDGLPKARSNMDKIAMNDTLSESVIGAAIEVHRHLGPGLLESIYEEALCVELKLRGIPYCRQAEVDASTSNTGSRV